MTIKSVTLQSMVNERRLVKTFLQLVKIPSPSGSEQAIRAFVLKILRTYKIVTRVDRAGNSIGKLPGHGNNPLLLAAHLDTVQPCFNVKPVIRGRTIMTDGTTILGADDKAGIAIILETIACLHEQTLKHRPLELVFTVNEELYNQGAKALDISKLKSAKGLAIDGAEVNILDYAAPYIATLDVTVTGKAAHSGLNPEDGINAIQLAAAAIAQMKLGRIDFETTANIGIMHGGTNRNSIPDIVTLVGEARSHSKRKLEQQLERMCKALEDAAELYRGTVNIASHMDVPGYSLSKTNPFLVQLQQVMRHVGIRPSLRQFCAATDANIFNTKGITTLNLGTGMRNAHTVHETLNIDECVQAAEVVLKLAVA